MERNYDLPSGDRIWELASEAVRIENSAKESGGLSYELFEVRLNLEADRAMRTMDPVERQFFATCFRGVYTPPEQRGEEWQSEQDKAKELREISAVPAGDEVKKTLVAELVSAERAFDHHIQRLHERLVDTSEDSYATRNELRAEIAQFGRFLHSVKSAEPGEIVDLTRKIVDYGYDPEAAACDHMCGLEYVSDFERAKTVYESCIWEISPIIETLEAAGMRVETGVISMAPPERDETMYDVEMEMER